MIKETLTNGLSCAIQKTNEGMNGTFYNNNSGANALAAFIVLIIYIIIILFIGKFLWNEVLCRLLSIAKPADNIWQILGLAILLNLLYLS